MERGVEGRSVFLKQFFGAFWVFLFNGAIRGFVGFCFKVCFILVFVSEVFNVF